MDTKNDRKTDANQEVIADLKNYLSIILLSVELLLKQEKRLTDKGKKRVQIVKKQVWRINELLPKPGK